MNSLSFARVLFFFPGVTISKSIDSKLGTRLVDRWEPQSSFALSQRSAYCCDKAKLGVNIHLSREAANEENIIDLAPFFSTHITVFLRFKT